MNPKRFKKKYPGYWLVYDIANQQAYKHGVTLSGISFDKPFIKIIYSSGVATETNYLDPSALPVTNTGRCDFTIARLLNLFQDKRNMNITKAHVLSLLSLMTNAASAWGSDDDAPKEDKKAGKKVGKKVGKKEIPLREKAEALADLYKGENSSKELKAFINEEFEVKTVAKVEDDDLEELIELFEDEGIKLEDEDGEDAGGDEDGIDVEAVKIACQAFSKSNGKDDMTEIFEEYDIKSVRSLSKLSAEQLEDLYADVTED